ncbi:MAG TPA: hydrogenase 2 operon protein HybA [Thermoanaerobaculia bacterium]|nr:hydrogenase 2 operon protein HybA [Thermoanaerobaculia bacterium]
MSGINRRTFMGLGAVAVAGAAAPAAAKTAEERHPISPDYVGVLVDTTLCIGCRKCEEACNRRNRLPRTVDSFSDREVLRNFRRPSEDAFTVVNQFPGSPSPDQAALPMTFAKVQCMHCLIPSCVSACIVGALTKAADGAVVYNSTICLGCRYCMIACPFEIPAYQYHTALTPRVRKCEMCTGTTPAGGADPACAAACPTEALVFGKRADLLEIAHQRLEQRPDRYEQHVYGEHEVGGTGWLYLTGRPVQQLGLPELPERAPALRTEAIQHGIFKYGILPVALYGGLAALMWRNRERKDGEHEDAAPSPENPQQGGAQ